MWEPLISSTWQHAPDGASKIVFDRFHIMKHMLEAVDAVRKFEHRRLLADGDGTLKRTTYLWFFSEGNFPEKHAEWFAREAPDSPRRFSSVLQDGEAFLHGGIGDAGMVGAGQGRHEIRVTRKSLISV